MGRGHAAGTVLCVPTSAEVGAWVCSALLAAKTAGVPGGSAVQAERVQGPLLLAGAAFLLAQQPSGAGYTAARECLLSALCRLDGCRVDCCWQGSHTHLRNSLQEQNAQPPKHSHQGVPACWPVQAGGPTGSMPTMANITPWHAKRWQASSVSVVNLEACKARADQAAGPPCRPAHPWLRYAPRHRHEPRTLQAASATLFLICTG